MLMLAVKNDDYVMIGDDIMIRVVKAGDTMKLAIDAPTEYAIARGKLYESSNPGAPKRSAYRSNKKPRNPATPTCQPVEPTKERQ